MKIKSNQSIFLSLLLVFVFIFILSNFKDGFTINTSNKCVDICNNMILMNTCNPKSLTQQFKSTMITDTNYYQLSVDNSSNQCIELVNGSLQLRNCRLMTSLVPGQGGGQKWLVPTSGSNTGSQSIQNANLAAWGCLNYNANNNRVTMNECNSSIGQNWSLL